MTGISIIAVGSSFNDDSIGWRLVEKIAPKIKAQFADTAIHFCGSPGTQLIHLLNRNTPTILLDALLDAPNHGKIVLLSRDELRRVDSPLSSHALSATDVLQLAENLGQLPLQLWILGIGISENELLTGEQQALLQDELARNALSIIARVAAR